MISVLIFVVTVSGFSALLVFFIWERNRVLRRLVEIEGQVGNTVPYWRAIQGAAITRLMHPHHAAERVDELLVLLKEDPLYPLTGEEWEELKEGMRRRAAGDDPLIGLREQKLAEFFPMIMEEVRLEAANPNPVEAVQLVGLKKPNIK